MHYVGVDLAWGQNNITGLAVLNATGQLLAATQRKTDSEIIEWLSPWTTGPCLVAIDAPIIVTNPTGNRPCESLVSRHFGKYGASCHSANLSKPHFANGTRALRLADQLGLAVNPQDQSQRRAVEVYPHPAIVVLFDLPRILQYKHKPGRDLEHLRHELLRLLDHLEDLRHASPPLLLEASPDSHRIRQAAAEAQRKVDLTRIEDSIDAIVCAYIAAYAVANPTAVRAMGDLKTGYILTPVTTQIANAYDSV
ncbi:DUF429 domain-containing protein [Kribbella albertanoniae]|uniref:DUF429 domain-containing protein n=1 Tax=Kribbella albertanoniae TaxID=1266829 RepID=A0A4R4QCK9_9ACTN|nr:DUF429 domain-containing protein [Kribbella albertanoniae]TDC33148.1 DUF429 domain-containing protein [Kribbella albertanoniae]